MSHPLNPVSPISSLGIVPDRVSSTPSSLTPSDRKQLNSIFDHVNNDIQGLAKGLKETNTIISNLASVMNQKVSSAAQESETDDGSSTLGGRSNSTTNTLSLLRDSSDFHQGRYI